MCSNGTAFQKMLLSREITTYNNEQYSLKYIFQALYVIKMF